MPVAITDTVKSSWADEVELEDGALPPSTEVRENGYKIVTDYKYNEDDKKVKIVRTYKIEKRIVSKSIAIRKTWSKFGESANDKPGPDPATTIIGEDVFMQFVTSKEEDNKPEDEGGIGNLKALGDKNIVKCRTCSGDHWTSKCPWRDTMLGGKIQDLDKKTSTTTTTTTEPSKTAGTSKYLPPSMRGDAASRRTDSTAMPGSRRDDTTAIRITNLSESTTEIDLEELVKPFGPIQKLYLAKDKQTGGCKGFAYIHFKFRNDAAKAIATLNGHGYDHLILTVDWSKPSTQSSQ